MHLLMNLLPGLREVRPPLASGFIWLFLAWLLILDSNVEPANEGGIVGAVYTLLSTSNTIGAIAAITFLAYILGTVSEVLFSTLSTALLDAWSAVTGEVRSMRRSRESTEGLSQRKRQQQDVTRALDIAESLTLGRWVTPRGATRLAQVARRIGEKARKREQELERRARDAQIKPREVNLGSLAKWRGKDVPGNTAEYITLQGALAQDIPQNANQIQEQMPARFSSYDRLRGEADFRLAIAPPIATTSIILGFQESLLWLLGLLATLLLHRGAWKKAREAGDLIAEVMWSGEVTTTVELTINERVRSVENAINERVQSE